MFPFVAICQSYAPRLAAVALWAELPVYGLLLSLFARKHRLLVGFVTVLFLHAGALAGALLLAP